MKVRTDQTVRRSVWSEHEANVLIDAAAILRRARTSLGPDANGDMRLARAAAAIDAVLDGVVVVPPDGEFTPDPARWPRYDPGDDLATWRLRLAAAGILAAEEDLLRTIAAVRAEGVTFTVIGAALGLTKQGAREAFQRAQKFGFAS